MLGFDHENIPTKGYISVHKEEEKDEQKPMFNTYMCWRKIKMVLELLFLA